MATPKAHLERAQKLCAALVNESRLTREACVRVLEYVQQNNVAVEEAILELDLTNELDLLRMLAGLHKTYYVSSEKLARAEIPQSVLALLPRKFAEQAEVLPVLFDARTHTLSIATAEPDNAEMIREVQIASGVQRINAFFARPAAISAALRKHYAGDMNAFVRFDRPSDPFRGSLSNFEKQVLAVQPSSPPVPQPAAAPSPPGPPSAPALSDADAIEHDDASTRSGKDLNLARATSKSDPAPRSSALPQVDRILDTFNVLVGLIEAGRGELRGHSAHVARLSRKLGSYLNLEPTQLTALELAAYGHDLTKMGQFHLTPLNVAEYEGHRATARAQVLTPLKVLSPLALPNDAISAISQMYERFDGKGFPDEIAGRDTALSARILAICDTYSDLTQSTRNPYRKALLPSEACDVLFRYRATIFDPSLVDSFHAAILGESSNSRLIASRSVVLVIEPDSEEAKVVELRFIEQGFVVRLAKTADQALKILGSNSVSVVVSELELGKDSGLDLLAEARENAWGADLPWVICTRRQDKGDTQRAFDLGATDFVTKPVASEVLVAKVKALLDYRRPSTLGAAMSGSLSEMSLSDLIQVMWHGKKSGNLKVRSSGQEGEIHLLDGFVVNATWLRNRGENAFYSLLGLKEGEFILDPKFKPTDRSINRSTETLLLEGMRRLDEGLVR